MLKHIYQIAALLFFGSLQIAAFQKSHQLPFDVLVTLSKKVFIARAQYNGRKIQVTRTNAEVFDNPNLPPLVFVDMCIAMEEVAKFARRRGQESGIFKRFAAGAISPQASENN